MKKIVTTQNFGEIIYEENLWTGKKTILIDNKPTKKMAKNTFTTEDGLTCYISGNYFAGTKLTIGEETVTLSPAAKKYEIILSVLPVFFILVWGNSPTLVNILPVVGGAIGGGVSGLFGISNLTIIKTVKQIWLKILISIAMLGITVITCYLIALAFLSII